MNNEILFLHYLDQQLPEKEIKKVEKMLLENSSQRALFETIRKKRQATLKALESLNPDESVAIPPVETIILKSKAERPIERFLWSPFLRYAAIILVLVALPLSIWLVKEKNVPPATSSTCSEKVFSESILAAELDFYISPNRCWNRRELVSTITQLNN